MSAPEGGENEGDIPTSEPEAAPTGRLDLGFAGGQLEAGRGSTRCGMCIGDTEGIGRGSEGDQFTMDVRSARLGVLELFEDEHAGPFPEHEAVAILVKRPGGFRGFVVVCRE